jgi:hypothetical protein
MARDTRRVAGSEYHANGVLGQCLTWVCFAGANCFSLARVSMNIGETRAAAAGEGDMQEDVMQENEEVGLR